MTQQFPDPPTESPTDTPETAALAERVRVLEARINLWAQNGLAVADTGSIFAGYGGASGTSPRVKRSDA